MCQAEMAYEADRTQIIQLICTLASAPTAADLRAAALECSCELVRVKEYYCHYMAAYLPGIAQAALAAVHAEDCGEEVVLQGIEFFSNLCNVEQDVADAGDATHQFITQAHAPLLEQLLAVMERQVAGADPTEWSASTAAHVCLKLVTETVKDACMDGLLTYVKANVTHAMWQKRDVAVQVLGAMLGETDNSHKTVTLVREVLPVLVATGNDPQAEVRDSLAWAFGRCGARFCGAAVCCSRILPDPSTGNRTRALSLSLTPPPTHTHTHHHYASISLSTASP
jgi:hypothetical protein